MGIRRDTVTYSLYNGKKKVYIGTTNDLEVREQAHQRAGKYFDRMEVTSRRMTEDGAKSKEANQLKTYRQGHRGKNPRYNKDSDG